MFAKELQLTNVQFAQKSFEECANSRSGTFDVVIAFHAFNMQRNARIPDNTFGYSELSESDLNELSDQMGHALLAMSNLLSADGIGVISGGWDDAGLICLFHSIRKAGLATNWSTSFWDGRHNTSDTKHYIFVREGIPHIGENA